MIFSPSRTRSHISQASSATDVWEEECFGANGAELKDSGDVGRRSGRNGGSLQEDGGGIGGCAESCSWFVIITWWLGSIPAGVSGKDLLPSMRWDRVEDVQGFEYSIAGG